MIKIPRCFSCKNFLNHDEPADTYRCAAFPDGIPDEEFMKSSYDKDECAAGYHYAYAWPKKEN